MTLRLYATYTDPHQLLSAIETLRARGYRQLEAYTPFPVDGLDRALGLRRSTIPAIAFWAGLIAAAVTYGVQWLIDAWSYPIDVGARPPHFPLSYVPICFEMGVLFSALAAFGGVFAAGKLGPPWHPVSEVPGIESATRDRFWLAISLSGAAVAREAEEAVHATGASTCARCEEEP